MIPDNLITILTPLLTDEEGSRKFPYDDATGKQFIQNMTLKGNLTIGIGWNLSGNGLPDDILQTLFQRSMDSAYTSAQSIFTEFNVYSPSRQAALIDMIFNMGEATFLTFNNFIKFIRAKAWIPAIDDLENTAYAKELPHRVADIERLLGQ
ncbi:MAG: hypothetical protein KGI54_16940 [Pseudomonadota bacterium]|nr:hypothetical protein [Pseudomonadota bacterium]